MWYAYMSYDVTLCSRLQNCLDTIFELEELLSQSEAGEFMQTEFVALKKASERVELASLRADDVELIEKATERLVRELYSIGVNTHRDLSDNRNIH